jgi:streptomycin 6-kinase
MTLGDYVARWQLSPDGEPIITPFSELLPVASPHGPAMLKLAGRPEEVSGGEMLEWWKGQGAARVFARDRSAVLLERAVGERSLLSIAASGRDDEATRIICTVAAELHARSRSIAAPTVAMPLAQSFAALEIAAATNQQFARAAHVSRELLASQQGVVVLHGDLHHANVLDFGAGRGWLAIDPKGLIGERTYDFANLLLNPDVTTALNPGRLARHIDLIARLANLDARRFRQWVHAHAALSAAWCMEDGEDASFALRVMEIAAHD